MRLWGGVVVAVVAAMVPLTTHATELELGLDFATQYDSNVFNRDKDDNVESDVIFRVSPQIRLFDEVGQFQFDLDYQPEYEAFVRFDGNNTWNHYLDASADYDFNEQTNLSFIDRFRDVRNGRFDTDVVDVNVANERRLLNTVRVGLQHRFQPRVLGTAAVQYTFFQYDNPLRPDGQTFTPTLGLNYQLLPQDNVGINATGIFQVFDSTDVNQGSFNQTYQVGLSWLHQFDPTLRLSISGGPTLIITDLDSETSRTVLRYPQASALATNVTPPVAVTGFIPLESCSSILGFTVLATCAPVGVDPVGPNGLIVNPDFTTFPPQFNTPQAAASAQKTVSFVGATPGVDNERFTFFGAASLVKQWEQVTASLTYRRTQRESATQGASEILDLVALRLNYRATRRLSFAFSGSWNRRVSATEAARTLTVIGACQGPTGNCTGLGLGGLGTPGTVSESNGLLLVTSNSGIDVKQWNVFARGNYRLTKNASVSLFGQYLIQDQRGDLIANRDINRWRLTLLFSAYLDSIDVF